MTPSIDQLRSAGVLSPLDQYFARALGRLAAEDRPEVLLAAALASRRAADGHVCLDLPQLAASGATWWQHVVDAEAADDSRDRRGFEHVSWPALEGWLAALRESALVAASREDAAADKATPLVVDARGRLYLRRYWDDERRLERALRARAELRPGASRVTQGADDVSAQRASIERLVPRVGGPPSGEPDWRRVAAAVALARGLAVICGGPGTGKTTTAAQLLAVLVEDALRGDRPAPRIVLLAPTGKAAARLGEAIRAMRAELDCTAAVREAIPGVASTIHRCLGLGGGPRLRRRNATSARRLAADVVLVDETSMVDLALMTRLVDAMPAASKLILLGDRDQLASVEAGSVLGDVCGDRDAVGYSPAFAAWLSRASGEDVPHAGDASATTPPIRECIVRLTRSTRYAEASGIAALARAVNAGDSEAALALLDAGGHPDVARIEPGDSGTLSPALREAARNGYQPFASAADPREKLASLRRFRVLCAVRGGPWGVVESNRQIELLLVAEGLIEDVGGGPTAPGRPLLVTRNAPALGLYNGDVGLLVRTTGAGGSALRAIFEGPEGELRELSPARLPPHEPVFAMSVHKSQGSEFDEVALLLPPRLTPLLTRELVYTALTRARVRVVIHASAEVLAGAIEQSGARSSGLRDALFQPEAAPPGP